MVRSPAQATQASRSSAPIPDAWIAIGIACAAFGVRLAYLVNIRSIPLFSYLIEDSLAYDRWAQRIARGDFGGGVFYQAPLYPYFLGALERVFGHDLWTIHVIQMLIGAGTCALVFYAGRLFFSRAAGIAAGFITAIYAPAIFNEGLIQKSVLDLAFVAALLVCLALVQRRPQVRPMLAGGVALGLLALTRENAEVWIPVIVAWIWLGFRSHASAERLKWTGAFLAGVLVVLVPVGLRNLSAGGEFALTTSQMGTNFYIGNNPSATGTYVPLRPGREDPTLEQEDARVIADVAAGRALSPGEVSHYWLGRGLDFVRAHPIEWLRLMGRKWMITWNIFEYEDSDDFYVYQEWSPVLRALSTVGTFAILAPLALVGVIMTWSRRRELAVLYALLASMAFAISLFYVFGRYRLPLVPILALFAGAAVATVIDAIRQRQRRPVVISAVAFAVGLIFVSVPVAGKPGPTGPGYTNLAIALAATGQPDRALEMFKRATEVSPDAAETHYNYGSTLLQRQDVSDAERELGAAVRLAPDYAAAHANLGMAEALRGDRRDAQGEFQHALALDPDEDDTRRNLGIVFMQNGTMDSAIDEFHVILAHKPDDVSTHLWLGEALLAAHRPDEALDELRATVDLEPANAKAGFDLAKALASTGHGAEAKEQYQRAVELQMGQQVLPGTLPDTRRAGDTTTIVRTTRRQ